MRYQSSDLWGYNTDRSRKLLEATGWVRADDLELWRDPLSGNWYTVCEAAAIQTARLQRLRKPHLGIPGFLRDKDR